MSELRHNVWSSVSEVAEKAIQQYARGLLTVACLQEHIMSELQSQETTEEKFSPTLLMRLAQRICSRVLCNAWRSTDNELRDCAFRNLRCHFERVLQHTHYTVALQQCAAAQEDVLHQTLEILYTMLVNNQHAGPDDPAAFLKWTQTILFRHARAFLQKWYREVHFSLEALPEVVNEQLIDTSGGNPVEYALGRELHQRLYDAIASIRNLRYRQVLIYTYLGGMSECEIAQLLHVQIQAIYMWRHRALKALRHELLMDKG